VIGKIAWNDFKSELEEQGIYPFVIVDKILSCQGETDPRIEGESEGCVCEESLGLSSLGTGHIILTQKSLPLKNAIVLLHEIGHNCMLDDVGHARNLMNRAACGTNISVRQTNLSGGSDLQVLLFRSNLFWDIFNY